MATSLHGDRTQLDSIFPLLEGSDIHVAEDIRKLIQDNLKSNRESWLVHTLVDYYYVTNSVRAGEILAEVREPQDKYLIDKLQDGIKSSEHKLPSLQLMLYLVYKQPPWTHKLAETSIFNVIIKCLKTEVDIPVVMTALVIITVLLPVVPVTIAPHLQEIFDIFGRLAAFSVKKPANTPDVFLLHLQVALYSLFHRLYGMYPSHFLTYLRQQFQKRENTFVYDEVIMPMLERVRLHPYLITGSRDSEMTKDRWKRMETQDIVVDCAKLSLDSLEGTWEELHCPIFARGRYRTAPKLSDSNMDVSGSLHSSLNQPQPPYQEKWLEFCEELPCLDLNMKNSPSLILGLSTPPSSQRTTPATSFMDTSASSLPPSFAGTNPTTPVLPSKDGTPRQTPTISDDLLGGSRSTVTQRGDLKRLSLGSGAGRVPAFGDLKLTPVSQPNSIPPSPLKPEFTAEPPLGTHKAQPMKSTIRALRFDKITEVRASCDRKSSVDSDKELTDSGKTDLEKSLSSDSDKRDSLDGDNQLNSLSQPVSMDDFHNMVQDISPADEDTFDQEVSELTKSDSSDSCEHPSDPRQTAESVKQFMKKVNRIRFNSLTNNGNLDHNSAGPEKRGSVNRSLSCPLLELEDGVAEESETLSRSASTTFSNHESDFTAGQDVECETDGRHAETKSSDDTRETAHSSTGLGPAENNEKHPSVVKINEAVSDPTFNIVNIFQTLLSPSTVCRKCRSQSDAKDVSSSGQKSFEMAQFNKMSPPELLDQHLKMGGELHAKELTKIPLTSKENVNWTHFGGVPPADEINILRGQILLLHNQILYERNKREMHAMRNRRLLRKIANAAALEEHNHAMANQIDLQGSEIHNLRVSLQLLQNENQQLKQAKESNEYEKLVQLRTTLQENKDLKMANSELKSLLITQREDHDKLKKHLQETESCLFNTKEEKDILQREVDITNKLKEQIFQLQKEILLMGELQQKYQEKINVLRPQQNAKAEQDLLVTSLRAEMKAIKAELKQKTVQLDFMKAKVIHFEEMNRSKEIAIRNVKTNLENVKTSHEDELKAVEDKYNTMMRMNQQLEGEILNLLSQIDQLSGKIHSQQQAISPDTNDPHRPLFQGQERGDLQPVSLDSKSVNETHLKSRTAEQLSSECSASELLQSHEKYSHGELDAFPRQKSSSQCSDTSLGQSQRTLYTDSDDSKSSSSSKATDSGCFEKSTK
ncbi:hamartin-like [Gigantopelta aegis]|uniref:hamartin-like n=1 Tax=Gigantopelta aegis TaxID=1735272 RepID=UPI001B88E120|nr:hamartin-like [Gigantopelta aegis]